MSNQSTLVSNSFMIVKKHTVHTCSLLSKVRERVKNKNRNMCLSFVDKIDFVRDIVAYMCAVALVIGVAYDGDVS